MATRAGELIDPGTFSESAGKFHGRTGEGVPLVPGGTNANIYYMMRWLDTDCVSTPTYRSWVVINNPDPTGTQYTGTKCGATAISGAVVAATWAG